jgi:hypothetical protein
MHVKTGSNGYVVNLQLNDKQETAKVEDSRPSAQPRVYIR